jgi:hypothetical protein
VYAGARTIPLFFHVGHQSELRMAALASSQRNEVFVADAFEQVEESWWFIGDDFRDYHKREMVVKYFDLGNLVFRAFDPLAALGASNVRILPRYELDPPGSLDTFGGFMMWPPRGFKIDVLHHETQIAIDDTRRRIAPVKLRTLELEVVFDDARPPLPAPRLLAGRFWPEHEHPDELYTADFKRRGRGATRDMILSKNLAGTDFEMYVVRVGETPRRIGSAKGGPLEYTPWRAGVYWILACHPTECFVVAATHQKA